MDTLVDLARFASALPGALGKAQENGVKFATRHVTKGIRQEIKVAAGGNYRLSGARGTGRVYADNSLHGTTGRVFAIGPVHWLEFGTGPHAIYPRGKKALKMKNGGFAAHAMHPGSRPKRTWSRGLAKTLPDVPKIIDEAVKVAIRKTLR